MSRIIYQHQVCGIVTLDQGSSMDRKLCDIVFTVNITVDYGEQLTIPSEAVLDSGMRQVVFVALADGYFEPREVKLGTRMENQYIVLSGIKSGEKVVTSGNFLIDSESRLSSATSDMKH